MLWNNQNMHYVFFGGIRSQEYKFIFVFTSKISLEAVSHVLKNTKASKKALFFICLRLKITQLLLMFYTYTWLVFHNTPRTREQMAGNWRRALFPREKLHVLFVPKVWQIYQINSTNLSN